MANKTNKMDAMFPTAELRYVEKSVEVRYKDFYRDDEFEYLEQKWVNPESGESEWRPIPTIHVTERTDENGTTIKHGASHYD